MTAQHTSLSNQLQKMYADHARAQGLYELEKQEHSKTRKDFEVSEREHKDELEKINSLHFDDKDQLRAEGDTLRAGKDQAERKLDDAINEIRQLKSEKTMLENGHQSDLQLLQNQESDQEKRSNEIYELQKSFDDLKISHAEKESNNQVLKFKAAKLEEEIQHYTSLKSMLQAVGVDALDLTHPRLLELSADERSLLFKHFGSNDEHIKLITENRLKADELENQRKQALESQRRAKEERDRTLQIRAQNNILNNEAGAQVAAAVGADLPSNEDENNSDDLHETDNGEVAFVAAGGEETLQENSEEQNQLAEAKAQEELDAQEKMMQNIGGDQANIDVISEDENHESNVINEIKKLHSAQQKIAGEQQANLLELQRHHEIVNKPGEFADTLAGGEEKYADEEESKVQLEVPAVAADEPAMNNGEEEALDQGFVNAPQVLAEDEEGPYKYDDGGDEGEQEEDEDVVVHDGHPDNYAEMNDEGADVDEMEEEDNNNQQQQNWPDDEAGKAALAERRKMEAEDHGL